MLRREGGDGTRTWMSWLYPWYCRKIIIDCWGDGDAEMTERSVSEVGEDGDCILVEQEMHPSDVRVCVLSLYFGDGFVRET